MNSFYRGVTWDHPRGTDALVAASQRWRQRDGGIKVEWVARPLEEFESAPIEDLAQKFDLIVLDHPHLGEAVATSCLQPLDNFYSDKEIAALSAQTVGASFDAYRMDGRVWALPLDVATQVSASTPDIQENLPVTWDDVRLLSIRSPVALSLAGPHAFLTYSSICVAIGEEPAISLSEYVTGSVGLEALTMMIDLASRAPQGTDVLNPISMLQTMSENGRIAYVPLIFGYVNYATSSSGPVRFGEAPVVTMGGRHGSTLGGTGLAISSQCTPTTELMEYLRWLLSAEAQEHFIPEHSGQPSSRLAWESETLNRASKNFYRSTHSTLKQAWVRPRYDGFAKFQSAASQVIREALSGQRSAREAKNLVDAIYRRFR